MSRRLRIAYFAHTLRSDWNNGNAHFLRGLIRALRAMNHDVTVYEPENEWSIENLRNEERGETSLAQFLETYSEFDIQTYSENESDELWRERLRGTEIVILHEWNPPLLAQRLLTLRDGLHFALIFHDTHHRASSSPEQIESFGLQRFDGVLAFGEALRTIYRKHFGLQSVWTLHEAADISVFHPMPEIERQDEVVWIGNWGEDERSAEIRNYFLQPAAVLANEADFRIFGVRYPQEGLEALAEAGVVYGGYLPNLESTRVYARARLTVHIPRQQYSSAMAGIPTIRVFEALACGVPLISAPWNDTENLFRPGDFRFVNDAEEMTAALHEMLQDTAAAAEQARRGLETVLTRHTCNHRAQELTDILEGLVN